MQKAASNTGASLASTVDSAHFASTAASFNEQPAQELPRVRSQPWEVQDFESRPCSEDQEPSQAVRSPGLSPAFADFEAQPAVQQQFSASWDWSDSSCWWSERAEWIQQKAGEILAAYNFFFEHIGIRKGWRQAPFGFEEVQAPFKAAAEVVVVVRARLDAERGGVLVLRQVEGSAMNFLWGWSPSRPPGISYKALADFFRGLVFATLSDGRGLVEGLDPMTVESYVCRHPLLASEEALAAAAAEAEAEAAADSGCGQAAGLDTTMGSTADAEAVPVPPCD